MNTIFDLICIVLLIRIIVDLVDIKDDLRQIKHSLRKRKLKLKFFTVKDGIINKKGVTMIEITKTQKQKIKVKAFAANGEEALYENIVYTSLNEAVCTVAPDETDPTMAYVSGVADGVAQVQFDADANLGEGLMPITGKLSVEVQTVFGANLGGEAVGSPEEQ